MRKFLYLVSGIIIGGGIGAYIYKTFISDKDMEDLKEECEHLKKRNKKLKKKLDEDCSECWYVEQYEKEHADSKTSEETEREDDNKEKISYNDMFTPEEMEELSEKSPEEDYADYHNETKDLPPEIITLEEYMELPYRQFLEMIALKYYTYDCVVTDDMEEEIEDPEILLGDILLNYDFADSDEETLYIRNYALDTVYSIEKVDEAYGDTH